MSRLGPLAALAILFIAAPSLAQTREANPPREGNAAGYLDEGDAPDAKKPGDYGGVKAGRDAKKNLAASDRACRRKNGTVVKWVGFQRRDANVGRVFAQMCSEGAYEQRLEGKTLLVSLSDAVYVSKNGQRRMDLRFFGTRLAYLKSGPVRRKKAKRAVEIAIEFQRAEDAMQAQAQVTTEKDGYTYLYLDFPAPGSDVPTPEVRGPKGDGDDGSLSGAEDSAQGT